MEQIQPEMLEQSGQFTVSALLRVADPETALQGSGLAANILAGFHPGLLDTSFMMFDEFNDELTMS